jgi:hypothetical protein
MLARWRRLPLLQVVRYATAEKPGWGSYSISLLLKALNLNQKLT